MLQHNGIRNGVMLPRNAWCAAVMLKHYLRLSLQEVFINRAQLWRRHCAASPIELVMTSLDEAVKRGPRPILGTADETVLHGVVVDVVGVRIQIVLVADGVLNEPRLPDATTA